MDISCLMCLYSDFLKQGLEVLLRSFAQKLRLRLFLVKKAPKGFFLIAEMLEYLN